MSIRKSAESFWDSNFVVLYVACIYNDCVEALRLYTPNKNQSRPRCSKLTTSLVNVSLKFQTLISEICQYFFMKKCENLLSFFQQKISVYLVIKL